MYSFNNENGSVPYEWTDNSGADTEAVVIPEHLRNGEWLTFQELNRST